MFYGLDCELHIPVYEQIFYKDIDLSRRKLISKEIFIKQLESLVPLTLIFNYAGRLRQGEVL